MVDRPSAESAAESKENKTRDKDGVEREYAATKGQNKGAVPRYYSPPNILREKIGSGGVPKSRIQNADQLIRNNDFDFMPIAIEILRRFESALSRAGATAKAGKAVKVQESGAALIDDIAEPIMELKANGKMFCFSLLTEVAEILLDFLENIDTLDADSLHVIEAHKNTLNVIVNNDLRGDGGEDGLALSNALYAACRRYYAKHDIDTSS